NRNTDWAIADVCSPTTIGSLNPGLDILDDNGMCTSLQSEPMEVLECSFTVSISDTELPMCSEYADVITYEYSGAAVDILDTALASSVITVPENFTIGDVNISAEGTHTDISELVFKLTSPAGTQVELFGRLCPLTADFEFTLDSDSITSIADAMCISPFGSDGVYSPVNSLTVFNNENSGGDWTLEIADLFGGGDEGQLISWSLELAEKAPYSQMDTTLTNEPGLCSADFTWTHPRLMDNCGVGSIEVKFSADSIDVPMGGDVVGGTSTTETFSVGTTTITYVLTDKTGNIDSCSFDVTVEDIEAPMIVCPSDITINLDPGECDVIVNYIPVTTTDNCAVTDTISSIPSGEYFEVGTTTVTLIVTDAAGNADTCEFDVTVIPYVPTDDIFVCNDQVNVSLDRTCCAVITADMILEGDDYGCYDEYCVEITDQDGNVIGTTDSLGNYIPKVTEDNIGDTLIVTVGNCITGNSCWGYIFIEDKLQPVIECPADTVVACNESTDTTITGSVKLLSCEDDPVITFEDVFTNNGECGTPRAIIERTWTVTDASGNFTTCVQIIQVNPFENDQIEFPEDFNFDRALACEDVAANPTLTEPSNTGYPTIDGQPIIGDHLCEVNVGYWDETLIDANCPDGFELLRHWIIRDECEPLVDGVNPIRHIQS
ncbi:MAG: HYR domain-containing protein, partial [Bacteroidota bacterium]